jgi:hypothetical protein
MRDITTNLEDLLALSLSIRDMEQALEVLKSISEKYKKDTDYPNGSILVFEKTFDHKEHAHDNPNPTVYTYVYFKTSVGWYRTGSKYKINFLDMLSEMHRAAKHLEGYLVTEITEL